MQSSGSLGEQDCKMVVRGDGGLVIGGFTFGEEEDACSSLLLNGDSQLTETTTHESEPRRRPQETSCFARAFDARCNDHDIFCLQRPC